YALPYVMHELYGHREYGDQELGMEIYQQAIPSMTTYGAPREGAEWDAYAYQETEIYSWMRQYEFFTPTRARDLGTPNDNIDPRPQIMSRIGTIKRQYQADVAESLVRGLWMRVRSDPRLMWTRTGADGREFYPALEAFEAGVRAHFPDHAEAILQ